MARLKNVAIQLKRIFTIKWNIKANEFSIIYDFSDLRYFNIYRNKYINIFRHKPIKELIY